MNWSLPRLLNDVHTDVEQRLGRARSSVGHTTAMGDASEHVWIEVLNAYLPARYRADRAFIADSRGQFSEQIDVVIYDRQYSPLIWTFEGQTVVAAESVYAVFESKQEANADYIKAARDKAQSVRRLHRTSLPIPHAGGVYPPKPLNHILGGILTLDCSWKPPLGEKLKEHLEAAKGDAQLDLGCIAKHGFFVLDQNSGKHEMNQDGKHATAFLFRLLSLLQKAATVPMIDVDAYGTWLNVDDDTGT